MWSESRMLCAMPIGETRIPYIISNNPTSLRKWKIIESSWDGSILHGSFVKMAKSAFLLSTLISLSCVLVSFSPPSSWSLSLRPPPSSSSSLSSYVVSLVSASPPPHWCLWLCNHHYHCVGCVTSSLFVSNFSQICRSSLFFIFNSSLPQHT